MIAWVLVGVSFSFIFIWLGLLSTRFHQWIVDVQNRVHALELRHPDFVDGRFPPLTSAPRLNPFRPQTVVAPRITLQKLEGVVVELQPGEPEYAECEVCKGLRIDHKPGCAAAPKARVDGT